MSNSLGTTEHMFHHQAQRINFWQSDNFSMSAIHVSIANLLLPSFMSSVWAVLEQHRKSERRDGRNRLGERNTYHPVLLCGLPWTNHHRWESLREKVKTHWGHMRPQLKVNTFLLPLSCSTSWLCMPALAQWRCWPLPPLLYGHWYHH